MNDKASLKDCDFAIIGSGYGGFIPALRLAAQGFSVVVFEKGKAHRDEDFKQSYAPDYFRTLYDCAYTNDFQTFFTTAKTLGGGSVLNAGASLRAPSEAFEQTQNGARLFPQSLSRRALEPYYDTVQKELSIKQIEWREVSKAGGKFADILHTANLSVERCGFNFQDCVECGFCQAGCRFGRKRTGVNTYIAKAKHLGAQFLTEAYVDKIIKRRDSFEVVYRQHNREQIMKARRVILAAGTIGNVRLLYNSRQDLPTLSRRIGERFNTSGALSFLIELPEADPNYYCDIGRTNPGIYSYAFWHTHRIVLHATTVPLAVFGAVPFRAVGEPCAIISGIDFERRVRELYPHKIVGGAVHGLHTHTGKVTIKNDSLKIEYGTSSELESYIANACKLLDDTCRKSNAKLLLTGSNAPFDLSTTLLLGTCAMSDSIESGVVDAEGAVWNCPGLYIADGSCISASLGVNPYFTIAANAERITEAIIASV